MFDVVVDDTLDAAVVDVLLEFFYAEVTAVSLSASAYDEVTPSPSTPSLVLLCFVSITISPDRQSCTDCVVRRRWYVFYEGDMCVKWGFMRVK